MARSEHSSMLGNYGTFQGMSAMFYALVYLDSHQEPRELQGKGADADQENT